MPKKLLESIKFSGIGEVFNLANSLGGDMVRFETGDVDFPTPEHIVARAYAEAKVGLTHYSPYKGCDKLREALAAKLSRTNRIIAEPENILITAGGSGALFLALQAMVERGDEIIIADPSWPHFEQMINLAGGTTVVAPFITSDGQKFDAQALEAAVTDKTRVILLNSPHNPTGAVLSRRNLQDIAEIAERCGAIVLSDEVYESFVFDFIKHESIGSFYDKTVSVYSFSKTYAMCGWRLGYIVADKKMIDDMTKLNLYSVTCIPPFIQMAGLAALESDQSCVEGMVREFQSRRNAAVAAFNSIPGVSCPAPKGAIYVWPDISAYGDCREVARMLIERARCVTVPGSIFGLSGKGRLRLSLSLNTARLEEGMTLIKEALIASDSRGFEK